MSCVCSYNFVDTIPTPTSWHKDIPVSYPFNKPGYSHNPITSGFDFGLAIGFYCHGTHHLRDSCWVNLYKNGILIKSYGGFDLCYSNVPGSPWVGGTQPTIT